jgi:molybdopterin molybdotransferase
MPEFIDLLPPGEALKKFLQHFQFQPGSEQVETSQARGRVLLQDVIAPHDLPTFDRSTVDGYAVRAADTHGASDSMPAYLELVGEVSMGQAADFHLAANSCGLIHTGGMLPGGADAVVMVENTQAAKVGEIEILRAASVGENVIKIGEDIQQGQVVVPAGKLIGAADIGGLLALGFTRIQVSRKPLVGIISSGDEVVPPGEDVKIGQVRDINSYSLAALIEQAGARPLNYGIIADQEAPLRKIAVQALEECDLLVITAGSSASNRDITARVINTLGGPGVIVHGVNVRPGKPTILAACQHNGSGAIKPVVGLPGNPVSALVIAMLFVEPLIDSLLGMITPRRQLFVQAQLTINLPSSAGREDWVPVKLDSSSDKYAAEPIFGKSNLIFTLAQADGLLYIPASITGYNAGDMVNVRLL